MEKAHRFFFYEDRTQKPADSLLLNNSPIIFPARKNLKKGARNDAP
jgi:hypothetical protein